MRVCLLRSFRSDDYEIAATLRKNWHLNRRSIFETNARGIVNRVAIRLHWCNFRFSKRFENFSFKFESIVLWQFVQNLTSHFLNIEKICEAITMWWRCAIWNSVIFSKHFQWICEKCRAIVTVAKFRCRRRYYSDCEDAKNSRLLLFVRPNSPISYDGATHLLVTVRSPIFSLKIKFKSDTLSSPSIQIHVLLLGIHVSTPRAECQFFDTFLLQFNQWKNSLWVLFGNFNFYRIK